MTLLVEAGAGGDSAPADIELIPMSTINEAYERMIKGDVKYRFVLDIKTLRV